MAKQLFGTDGIRGVAGQYPLNEETVYATGWALAGYLDRLEVRSQDAKRVLIGMDTRESSRSLAELLAGGLKRGGVAVEFGGVIPTAAVAYLTEFGGLAAGVMISASHNSFEYNGIKVFGPSGSKLPDSEERQVEAAIFELLADQPRPQPGALECDRSLEQTYLDHLLSLEPAPRGAGRFRVVADCANGAASSLAPRLLEGLGVAAEILFNQPDGRNINHRCGSLHMETLRQRVVDGGADLGVAFDGDADRALFVAEDGGFVDGDVILLAAARYLAEQGRLANNLVVTTVMANMGLEKALRQVGIQMRRTAVGDKYVLEEMVRSGAALGGEQSGHIIFRDYASTGDGLLTARMMLAILGRRGERLSALKKSLPVFPQQLSNLPVAEKVPFEQLPALAEAIAASERELGDHGRILVRYSGTEPLVRIMVEAEDAAVVERHTARLTELFKAQLGVRSGT